MGLIAVSVTWVDGVRSDGVVGLEVDWFKIEFFEYFEKSRLNSVVWRDERARRVW
jgi:hypothetical protein